MLPAVGGAIGTLRYEGRDVLRPTIAGTDDPFTTACFPLVPYANRIAHGRFDIADETVQLPRNFGTHPHSLHGVGWLRRWSVADVQEATATLTLSHDSGAAWPWRFTARQRVALDAAGLTVTLTLRNDDARPMPAGLGFHPYFPATPDSRLTFAASRMWLADETMLATQPDESGRAQRWAAGAPVRPFLDNAFEEWAGTATLDGVRLTADDASWLHVYIPEGETYCCIEPVSHGPDAINRDGMPLLEPGATASLTMRIEAP